MNTRHGTISSSSIWKIMTKNKSGTGMGERGMTYIKQVQYEQQLGRPLNAERDSRPTTWGKLVEKQGFDILSTSYQLISDQRLYHPDMPYWSGMPDAKKVNTVADIKCPYSLEVFCDKLLALQDISKYKSKFPEDYWQHISNAILLNMNGFPVTHFEPIIYCPYQKDLASIRLRAYNTSGEEQRSFQWIYSSTDEELPYILNDGTFKDLNIFRFEIPKEDEELLISEMEKLRSKLSHT